MSNKKRISKKAQYLYKVSDREKLDQFVKSFSAMSDKLTAATFEMYGMVSSTERLGKIGDQINLGGNKKDNCYQVPKHFEKKAWLDVAPKIVEFKKDQNDILNPEYLGKDFEKYKNSWIEEFKKNPENKKPFLKYLLDRFNLEVPIPDQFKRN